jgi:hypothetical protein
MAQMDERPRPDYSIAAQLQPGARSKVALRAWRRITPRLTMPFTAGAALAGLGCSLGGHRAPS